jgi:hypothetical protein
MLRIVGRARKVSPIVVASVVMMSSFAAAASSWKLVPSPNPGSANSIGGLVAFSPNEVWGVGSASSSSYAGCKGRTLAARWNGSAFVEVQAPFTAMCAAVNSVGGTSTQDIWAVGSTNEGRDTHLRHWDGTNWATVAGAAIQVPPSGGRRHRSTALYGITALSSTNVWAVGNAEYADFSNNTLVEHWNGSAWSLVPAAAATGSTLRAISAVSASDMWAVGSGGSSGSATFATLIEHWNGTQWSVVSSPNTNKLNYLRGVSAVSTNDVWAVGDAVKDPFDGFSVYRTLIQHWDGKTWTIVPAPNVGPDNNSLAAVAARSTNDVWAVGYWDDRSGDIPIRRTLVEHWNGMRWKVVASPNAGTGDNWLTSVVAPAATQAVFASGNSAAGTLIEYFPG